MTSTHARVCQGNDCHETIVITANSRQRFCKRCQRVRRKKGRLGIPLDDGLTAPVGRSRYTTDGEAWVCAYLTDHPCEECGQTLITTLSFVPKPYAKGAVNVFTLAANGSGPTALEEAARLHSVLCACCLAHRRAVGAVSYRVRWLNAMRAGRSPAVPPTVDPSKALRAVERIEALSLGHVQRRIIPTAVPEAQEASRPGVVQTRITRPRPAGFPASDLGAEATPEQPTHRRPQVDVRDLTAGRRVGQPVGEATSRGGPNDAIDTGDEAGF